MKSIKIAKKAKLYPFLGVFLGISSLVSLNSPLKAMERQVITEKELSASASSSNLLEVQPLLASATMAIAPEVNQEVDEITVDDQETITYLPDAHTKKRILKAAQCTHPGCTHVASNKSNLSQHMMRHTKLKRFACSVQGCNYSAHFACHIRAHIRKTHKVENA